MWAASVRHVGASRHPGGGHPRRRNEMPEYVFAYPGGSRPESEAEQAAVMTSWINLFGTLGDAVVDGGNPVGASKTIVADGSTTSGGGANPLTGYSLVK